MPSVSKKGDWYVYGTSLKHGLVSSIIMRYWESFSLPINLNIRFLNSACKVAPSALQNISLALHHRGFINKALIQSLYATWSLCMLFFLNMAHKGPVYRKVQYVLKRLWSEHILNFLANMLAWPYKARHSLHMTSSSDSWYVIGIQSGPWSP